MNRKYNISQVLYQTNGKYVFSVACNGWTVYNVGSTTVYVNRIPVPAGSFVAIQGNKDEVYIGRLDITFDAVSASGNMAWVVEKFYTDGVGFDNLVL